MTLPKVYVSIPNLGKINTYLSAWLLHCAVNFHRVNSPIIGDIQLQINRPVEVNRNCIVRDFLKTDCTHLLFIDNDITPSKEMLPRLLARNKDIVCGYVPIWHPTKRRPTFFAFKKINGELEELDPKLGFQENDFTGTGVMMIKREVFERLEKPFFKQIFDENIEKVLKGEDQYFCEYAKKYGFEIFTDCTSIEGQLKNIDVKEVLPLMNNLTVQSQPKPTEKTFDLSKFKNKLFIGRQQKTEDGITMDIVGDPDISCDISKGIPSKDNSFDYVEIHHLLEHFDNDTFIKIVQDIHRILKPDGIVDIRVPNGKQGFGDPTHKIFFNNQTFLRFTKRFWKEYENKCYWNDQWFNIVYQDETDTEIHIFLKVDKKIEVLQE